MKNAKIPQLHFSLLAATWHTQLHYSARNEKKADMDREFVLFCFFGCSSSVLDHVKRVNYGVWARNQSPMHNRFCMENYLLT